MVDRLLTIGVYGFTETAFFQQLAEAQVDSFCDLRSRRGMRGKQYAFVNSAYLQEALRQRGIRYLHLKELAPSDAIREAQKIADRRQRISKQQRETLDDAFIERYQRERLATLDLPALIAKLENAHRPCLFCVERLPSACHRSLAAKFLSSHLGVEIQHLLP
jgi:uncharacterized protein (DUF488 family)